MIEELFKTDFVEYLNNRRPDNLPEWTTIPSIQKEVITDRAFDITDISDAVGSVKRPIREGEATYYNNDSYIPCFVRYDVFLSQFRTYDENSHREKDWAKGIKRADYIVYDKSEKKKFFIIHELSKGGIRNKRSKGIKQLLDTVSTLWDQVRIKTYIENTFNKLLCYLSIKKNIEGTPLSMADGFLEIYKQVPESIAVSSPDFEARGFTVFMTNVVRL